MSQVKFRLCYNIQQLLKQCFSDESLKISSRNYCITYSSVQLAAQQLAYNPDLMTGT